MAVFYLVAYQELISSLSL